MSSVSSRLKTHSLPLLLHLCPPCFQNVLLVGSSSVHTLRLIIPLLFTLVLHLFPPKWNDYVSFLHIILHINIAPSS